MNRTLKEGMARVRRQTGERDRGQAASMGLRMTSAAAAERTIVSVMRLPVAISNEVMQAPDGSFLYDPDYSDDAGGDVGAPGVVTP